MSQEHNDFPITRFEVNLSNEIELNSKFPLKKMFVRIKDEHLKKIPRKHSKDEADKVRESGYGLEDILEECLTLSKKRSERKQWSFFNCYTPSELLVLRKNKEKLRSIENTLQSLPKVMGEQSGSSSQHETETNPSMQASAPQQWSYGAVDISNIFGWNDLVKEINEALLKKDDLNLIGIVGNFGTGKTALAQKIFMSEDVMDAFVLRLWVCVSPECKPEQLVRRMLDNLGLEDVDSILEMESEKKRDELGVLLFLLHLQLLDKKYLIVLDNICNDNVSSYDHWYTNLKLEPPEDKEWTEHLAYGLPKGNGSAIIVTSRARDVATKMVGRENIYHPNRLGEDDGWLLFKSAFKECQEMGKGYDLQSLEALKHEIIQKCDGHPLALKTAGRELAREPVPEPKDDSRKSKVDDYETNTSKPEEPLAEPKGDSGKPKVDDFEANTSKPEQPSAEPKDNSSKSKDDDYETNTSKPKEHAADPKDDSSKSKVGDYETNTTKPKNGDTNEPEDDETMDTNKPKDDDTSEPSARDKEVDDTRKNKDDSDDTSEVKG